MNVGSIPDKQARLFPNRLALTDERSRLTFGQFARRVNQLARGLIAVGVQKGDRVALMHHNCTEFVEVYFAAMKAGAAAVPINFRLAPREIDMILRDAEPSVVIVGAPYIDGTTPLMANHPGVNRWISMHGSFPRYTEYEAFLSGHDPQPLDNQANEDDIAAIVYTGGTTGLPKGVMHTHRSLTAEIADALAVRLRPDDVQIKLSPIFHITFVTVLFSLIVGARTHLLSRFPGVEAFLNILEEEGITWGVIPPAVTLQIANMDPEEAKAYDFSKFRLVLNGSSPLSGSKLRKALEMLDCHVYNSAGMTECPQYSGIYIEDFRSVSDELLGCAGREGVNSWVKIVDEEGLELPSGQSGELMVKSDKFMKGYWRNPQLTLASMKDGWFYTGDICRLDPEGNIYFLDRKKDMVISGGENVYSKEVEDVLHLHPDIAEAAVIGVPDDKWGEAVQAFVVRRQGKTVAEHEIVQFCLQHLAKYKVPKWIVFCESLPRSPIGKVMKQQLRQGHSIHRFHRGEQNESSVSK